MKHKRRSKIVGEQNDEVALYNDLLIGIFVPLNEHVEQHMFPKRELALRVHAAPVRDTYIRTMYYDKKSKDEWPRF